MARTSSPKAGKTAGQPRTKGTFAKLTPAEKSRRAAKKAKDNLEKDLKKEASAQKDYSAQAQDPAITVKGQAKLAEIASEEATHKKEITDIKETQVIPPPPPATS